jgi:hypothetical protein
MSCKNGLKGRYRNWRNQAGNTNNQDENDIRITRHSNKFRVVCSMERAMKPCLICSYLSTFRKQNVSATTALSLLLTEKLPDIFMRMLNNYNDKCISDFSAAPCNNDLQTLDELGAYLLHRQSYYEYWLSC